MLLLQQRFCTMQVCQLMSFKYVLIFFLGKVNKFKSKQFHRIINKPFTSIIVVLIKMTKKTMLIIHQWKMYKTFYISRKHHFANVPLQFHLTQLWTIPSFLSHFIFQLIQFSSTVIVIVFSNDTRLASFNTISTSLLKKTNWR